MEKKSRREKLTELNIFLYVDEQLHARLISDLSIQMPRRQRHVNDRLTCIDVPDPSSQRETTNNFLETGRKTQFL